MNKYKVLLLTDVARPR